MSTSGFPLDSAEFIGTSIESVLYGAAVLATIRTISHMQARVASGEPVKWVFRAAPWILIVIATLHISVGWFRSIHAFTELPGRDARVQFFVDITSWSYAMKDYLYTFQVWIGDAIILYRAYIVWDHQWLVLVIPAVSWAVTFASSIGTMISEAQATPLFVGHLKIFISIAFLSTAVTSVYCTAAILVHIYRTKRRSTILLGRSSGSARLLFAVLQSGLMYSAAVAVMYAFFQAGSNIQYILFNGMCSLIALSFNNMVGRQRPVQFLQTISQDTTSNGARLKRPMSKSKSDGPFKIGVSQVVEIHRDRDSEAHISTYESAEGYGHDRFPLHELPFRSVSAFAL